MHSKRSMFKAGGRIWGLFLASVAVATAGEMEINLVRNGEFKPGMDQQGPADWTYYLTQTNIYDAGRGHVTFNENGMTLEGPASLFQLDMWDDLAPAYKFSCRMKSEGGRSFIYMRIRDRKTGVCRNSTLANSKLNVWEDLALDVNPGDHYGYAMKISVPKGVKLSISSLKVTAVLKPDDSGKVLISDKGDYIQARGIRLPAEPNWAEQLAAHELRVNAYLVSGAVLPVLAGAGAPDEKGFIRLASLKKMISDKPAPATEPEANGFQITCGNGNAEITGGNDAGVLAGVAHLSELLGAKYYVPQVYSIAANPTLKIPEMDIDKKPVFEFTSGGPTDQNQGSPWKCGYLYADSCVAPSDKASPPMPSWIHPVRFLAPPYLYAEKHPEYYALVKGKRIEGFKGHWGNLNLCLGNPDLQKVVAERIARLMDLYPQCRYFGICQGDGMRWCECDLCKALDVDKKSWTDRLIAYANAVAELLNEKHPDKKLLILAYGPKTEELPLKAKLHPNVRIMYCFWPSSWPIWEATVCEQNKRGLQLLDDWNALTGTNLTLFLYPVNTYENADKLKLAAAKGIRGFHQCGLRGDFPEITLYTTGRLIWDPDADVEKMIDEIMPHMYGAAAPYMRSYFDMYHRLIRELVADPAKRLKYREKNTGLFKRISLDYAEKALDLMNKAEKAAGDDKYILMKIPTERFKILYAYINELQAVYPDMSEDQFADYALKMAELVKLARKRRVPFAGYKEPFSDWLYNMTGVLDFDRSPKWFNDKKIDLFLADPVKTLKTRVYLQEKITNGWELPGKAWLGSRYFEKYLGKSSGAVVRRQSSSESRVRAYLKLDTLPGQDVELQLQGLDNEKKEKAEISIKINGHEIFAGPVGFPKAGPLGSQENKWGWQTYKIPRAYLKAGENVFIIEGILGDYKKEVVGLPGPAEEALAGKYNWGWCMVGTLRLTGWSQ